MANESTAWLYEQLKSKGYNVGKNVAEFDSLMRTNADSRQWAYDTATNSGLNVGKDIEEFSSLVGGGTTASASTANTEPAKETEYFRLRRGGKDFTVSADEVNAAGGLAGWAKANPGAPLRVYMQGKRDDGNDFEGHVDLSVAHDRSKQRGYKYSLTNKPIEVKPQKPWLPTEQQKIAMSRQLHQMQAQSDAMFKESRERTKNLSDYYSNSGALGFKTVDGKPEINPETGKMGKTYLTPTGDRTTNKAIADKATSDYRQALEKADMTLGGQLRRAYAERSELDRKANERLKAITDGESSSVMGSILSSGDPMMGAMSSATSPNTQRVLEDPEYQQYRQAIREIDQRIQTLENRKFVNDGGDQGFWRSFGQTITSPEAWGGMTTDFLGANAKMQANHSNTESAQTLKKNIAANEFVQNEYGDFGFWSRAGVMTGMMAPIMAEFRLGGNAFEGINVAGKAATRMATKGVGKKAVEEMAKMGVKAYAKKYGAKGVGRMAGNWVIKALGTTADDLLIRAPLLTNTIQGGRTAASIVDRKLGDVTVDVNGNYDFTNDKTWGSAIWEGEANAIIENYSEMFGTHLSDVEKTLAKILGGKRISGMLARANASSFGKILDTTRQQFQRLGVSDYFGEVSEEYYGQLWRSMLNLDDAYTNVPVLDEHGNQVFDADGRPVYERKNRLFTGQFHGDIWGGMALSMGLMGAGKYGLSGAAYGSMKHQVSKADKRAAEIFTPERWEPIRELIDNTTNEDMGVLAENMVNDQNLSDDERSAVMEYMERSLNFRGMNLGSVAQSRGAEGTEEAGPSRGQEMAQEAREAGYNMTEPEQRERAMRDIRYRRSRVAEVFGREDIDEMLEDELGTSDPAEVLDLLGESRFDTNERAVIADYINARETGDSVMRRMEDDLRAAIEKENAFIDKVSHEDGYVRPATMKAEGRQVYIVKGNVELSEDGTVINTATSDDVIYIYDPATDKVEQTSTSQLAGLGTATTVEESRSEVERTIREKQELDPWEMQGNIAFRAGDEYMADVSGEGPERIQIVGFAEDGKVIYTTADGKERPAVDARRLSSIIDRYKQEAYEAQMRQQSSAAADNIGEGHSLVRTGDESGHVEAEPAAAIENAPVDTQYNPNDSFRVTIAGRQEMQNSIVFDREGEKVTIWTPFAVTDKSEKAETMSGYLTDLSRSELDAIIERDEQGNAVDYVAADRHPRFALNDEFTILDDVGNPIHGSIVRGLDEDEMVEIETEKPINGSTVNYVTPAELEDMLDTYNGEPVSNTEETPAKADGQGQNTVAQTAAEAAEPEQKSQGPEETIIKEGISGTAEGLKAGFAIERERIGNEWLDAQAVQDAMRTYAEGASSVEEIVERAKAGSNDERTRQRLDTLLEFDSTRQKLQGLLGGSQADGTALSRIPVDEQGQPKYEEADPGTAWDAIVEQAQGDEVIAAEVVADIVADRQEDFNAADKALTKIKEGKPEKRKKGEPAPTIADRIAAKNAAKTALAEAQSIRDKAKAALDHWKEIAGTTQRREAERHATEIAEQEAEERRKASLDKRLRETFEEVKDVPEAVEVLENMDPRDIHEVAASLLSVRKVLWSDKGVKVGVKSETGFGEGERRRLFGLFASEEKGGMSLSRLAEDEMKQECETYGIPYDNQEARNALIDVISGARTVSDIRNYIADRRIEDAQTLASAARRHEEELYDRWCQEELHMSARDVEMYEGVVMAELAERDREFDENEYYGYIADEMARQANNNQLTENGKQESAARRGSPSGDRGIQSNDAPGESEISGRGNEVLSESRTNQAGGVPTDAQRPGIQPTDGLQGDGTPSAVAEDASGRVGRTAVEPSGYGDFGPIFTQFKGDAKGAVSKLIELKTGEAIGALHHRDIGDIDLVWGKAGTGKSDGFGLAKLVQFHPEVVEHLQEIIDDMHIVKRSVNRINLESETHKAAVRLTWNKEKKKWLLTAFEKKETSESIGKTTDTDENPSDLRGDTALSQNSDVSGDKGNTLSSEKQGDSVNSSLSDRIKAAESEVNTNPSEAQKEAGNYKMGHVKVDGLDISIENPKDSKRSGKDPDGTPWETEMKNTYGYIKGTTGVDGDKIDVFLSDSPSDGDVYVVDQYNKDGSFDEHKVMYGFTSATEAEAAYLSNYSADWAKGRKVVVTGVTREEFKKWLDASDRKRKPFAEYKSVRALNGAEAPKQTQKGPAAEASRQGQKETANVEVERRLVEFARRFKDAGTRGIPKIEREMRSWFSSLTPESLVEVDGDMLGRVCTDAGLDKGKAWALKMSIDKAVPKELLEKVFELRNQRKDSNMEPEANGEQQDSGDNTDDDKIPFSIGKGTLSNDIVYEAAKGLLDSAGIEVVEVGDAEAQAMLINKDASLNTTKTNQKGAEDTAISSDVVANIPRNPQDYKYHIKTYHGTHADFEAFDHGHMGEGEGNQAFGWGTYVSESEGIGRYYAKWISKKNGEGRLNVNGREMNCEGLTNPWRLVRDLYTDCHGRLREMRERAERYADIAEEDSPMYDVWPQVVEILNSHKRGEIKLLNPQKHLYTVEIPDDTGDNYLDWDGKIADRIRDKISLRAALEGVLLDFFGDKVAAAEYFSKMGNDAEGFQLYRGLVRTLGSDKSASEFLSRAGLTGIKYPTESLSGGNRDGKSNYVIFNDADLRITDHARYLKDSAGIVYGWTMGGKVYLNRDAMNPETPLHEYTHLWDEMVQKENPELWARGKELMKETPLWEEVMNDPNYADIRDDEDAVASEVHSRLTGKDGAKILSDMIENARKKGIIETAKAVTLVERLKHWLSDMFKSLKATLSKWSKRDLYNLTVEDFTRMTLRDLAEGMNPRQKSENIRFHAAMSRAPFNLTVLQESQLSDVSADEAEEDVLCRPVTDKATLDRLNSEPTIKVYRAMQMIDGGLRPPMSGKVDGQWRDATEVGVWEEAEEHPEMADENGRFKLDKGNGKSIKAAYNPYIHTSRSPINDQFSSAWSRPELVTVEVEIPESELTSGYRAEKANAPVGEKDWKSGPVSRALAKIGQARRVILSRWSRIIRVVPVEEVAEAYAQRLNAHGIEVPFNTVPPALRDALAERGVKIGKPEKGNAGKASMPAFEQWIMEQERMRQGDGYGAYSDAELSYMNDPVSRVLGKNRFSKKQQAEFAARERQRMADRIGELAERMRLDNVEIVTDASQLEGKRATAKGFYNKRTGKITIVIPNNVSTIDAEQTLLHEAVGHYGLRRLFGNRFNTFLDNVYESADIEIRRKIAAMAAKNGWNFRTATEEYLAGLAEGPNFEDARSYSGWWSRIKSLFIDMLEQIGFVGFRDRVGAVLTDNELRYILWRSYENLQGRDKGIFGEAADVAKQSELKVGNYAEKGIEAEYAAEPISNVNNAFNTQLRRYISGQMPKNEFLTLGEVRGIMRGFLPNLPIVMRQRILSKASETKHNVELMSLTDLPEKIAHPIFVFQRDSQTIGILTEIKDREGKNVCVAIELNRSIQSGGNVLEVNDVRSIHGRDVENIILPIVHNDTLRYVDKEKGLAWLSSASSNYQQEIAKQDLYSATKIVKSFENPTIEEEELFRPGDFSPRDKVIARDAYDRIISSGSYQFREALQDSMLSLKRFYQSILGEDYRIEDVPGFENAYWAENRMSSENSSGQHEYILRYLKPLLKEIAKIAGANKRKRQELTDYMMAKHGLERNEYMRNEAAAKGENTNRDFAGLTALTGESDWKTAEATAQQWVDDYEKMVDTKALWEAVNNATKATLETVYLSGLISKDTYNKILGMYQYYVPLRGWDETTSEEVYGYLTSKDGPLGGSIMKKTEGRRSKADDPIATISMMADDAIRQGKRNLMKQHFLNFVLNHPSDAVSVHDIWLEHDDVTDEWRPVFADVKPTDSAEVVAQKVEDFEQDMEALQKKSPNKYKKGREAQHIPYKVVKGNLREHQVLIKRNGRTYVATINGNPRLAQAINGLTNPDVELKGFVGNAIKGTDWINRKLSAFYTALSPAFIVSNFLRDALYTNFMSWLKESPRYAIRFFYNYFKFAPLSPRRVVHWRKGFRKKKTVYSTGMLLRKWENGTLNMADKYEKLFYQFMKNGGETGYTSLRDIERHKKDIASELKKLSHNDIIHKGWYWLGQQLNILGRAVEDSARFAAFVTSMEFGRQIDRSIYDAKEISVNFNKKGSGGKMVNAVGQTWIGKTGSYISGFGRALYIFWNTSVQSLFNNGRQAGYYPTKYLVQIGMLYALGYFVPILAKMMGGCDGDDDDKNSYYNLPEYIRRTHICIRAGEQWLTIPLPPEHRAFYGLGELTYGAVSGNERYSKTELAMETVAQFSQLLPLDILEGGGGFSALIPSYAKPIWETHNNKSWTGLPVYKDTPFNKNEPEWTKAYASADQHLVALAKWLNEISGGDDFKKGAIDINPAQIEYLIKSTFGGVASFPNEVKKAVETAVGGRDFEWRNMPLANRIIKSGDERTANRKLQNEFFKYEDEY